MRFGLLVLFGMLLAGCAALKFKKTTAVEGLAESTKAGAVIKTDDGKVVLVDQLATWQSDYEGWRVTATGVLRTQLADGGFSEKPEGDPLVLQEAKWGFSTGKPAE